MIDKILGIIVGVILLSISIRIYKNPVIHTHSGMTVDFGEMNVLVSCIFFSAGIFL
jgi:hypothetical protein